MKPFLRSVPSSFGKSDVVKLAENIISNWLLGLRESNPALIDMFAFDDDEKVRDKLSWSGEFPGKYVTSCCFIYRLTGNKKLLDYTVRVADELISYQKENGYLGVWGRDYQLTGYGRFVSQDGYEVRLDTWDAWSHYHEIEFQCKPGAPELNCCSVNAPRPLGTVSEWAYLTDGKALYVNYYGNSKTSFGGLELTQRTAYPSGGSGSYYTTWF